MVNSGQCKEAVALLDLLLGHHPGNVGALAARGTARALLGALQGALGMWGLLGALCWARCRVRGVCGCSPLLARLCSVGVRGRSRCDVQRCRAALLARLPGSGSRGCEQPRRHLL